MKKCSYCGRQNPDEAVACSECGNKFERLPESDIDPELLDTALTPVVVAKFSSLQQASLLVARLQEAGIEAWIPEEYAEQVFSAVIALERLTVRVAAKDYEAAKAVLAEGQETLPTTDSPHDAQLKKPIENHAVGKREAQDSQGTKLCVSCRKEIPYQATLCPECGWTQPPLR